MSVYAFADTFDKDVSEAQRKARQELARSSTGRTRSPATPSRPPIGRMRCGSSSWRTPSSPRWRPAWPGPAPDSFLSSTQTFWSCGTLSGAAAEKAYAAARRNPGAVWSAEGDPADAGGDRAAARHRRLPLLTSGRAATLVGGPSRGDTSPNSPRA